MQESALLEVITARLGASPRVIVGAGDDAAVVEGADRVVLAHDMVVEDVHFRWATAAPEDVGHRALAVNLSDLAAMGAEPVAALVGLAVGRSGLDGDGVARLYEAMRALGDRTGCPVVGGDVSDAAQTVLGVTVVGRMPDGVAPALRSGGRPGDAVCVTGALGASHAGLRVLEDPALGAGLPEAGALATAHLRPEPLLAAGRALAAAGVHAMMDCSDGLAIDLRRMALASGVCAVLDLDRVPVAPGVAPVCARAGLRADVVAATGGEDYQLIAALRPGEIAAAARAAGVPLVRVGTLVAGDPGLRVERAGRAVVLERLGWEHGA